MALPNPLEAFVWGKGGAKMTPEQIAREREIAASLTQIDTSPVGHWTQGLARVANAAAGAYRGHKADKAAQTNASADGDFIAKMLSGGDLSFPPAPSSSGAFPAAPVADTGDYASQRVAQAHAGGDTIRSGLVARGLPEHVADAFVMNFQDESGLNPGINEQAPIVPGSRGGFGLAQWTGPRRRALEFFASERGLPVADPELQMDFLMSELQGPEANAMKSIMAAPDSGSAAAAIVNNFLRPAESHRASREARYLGSGQRVAPVQVASLDQSIGVPFTGAPMTEEQRAARRAELQPIVDQIGQPYSPARVEIPPQEASAPPMPAEYAATGLSPAAWERMNSQEGAPAPTLPAPTAVADRPIADPQQQIAQALMGPNTPLDQVPVMAGGTSGAIQPGQTAQGINPAIIEALSSPYASDQTKKIAGMLLGQQMEASDPAAQLDMDYKRAQIAALQKKGAGGDETFFGNPVAVQNADGTVSYGQMGNCGTFQPIQLPEGTSFAPPTKTIDTGTETILMDQAGNVISRTPKQNREAARDTALGTTEGKTVAEQAASAPADYQTAQNALDLIASIRKDPAREQATGKSSIFNAMRGTSGYDFQQKVEQAKSGAFLSAIQQMRGMGALSNAEGTAATAAITRMDTALTEDGFVAALDDYEKIVRQAMERAGARLPEGKLPPPPAAGKRLKFNPVIGDFE